MFQTGIGDNPSAARRAFMLLADVRTCPYTFASPMAMTVPSRYGSLLVSNQTGRWLKLSHDRRRGVSSGVAIVRVPSIV